MSKTAPSQSKRATSGGAAKTPATNDASVPRHSATHQPGRDRRRDARVSAGKFEVSVRDKDAVIFGLGRNLPISRKMQLQRRLYYVFAGAIGVLIIAVLFAGWLSVNVIQPNQTIVSVNGQSVPQKVYRYMVAYLAQDRWNQLQSANAEQASLQEAISNTKDETTLTALNAKLSDVGADISSLQTSFTQAQVDSDAIDDLEEDLFIQQAIPGYLHTDPKGAAALRPTTKQINDAYNAFVKAFPPGQSIGNFLSQDNMSKDNVISAIEVVLRQNAMSTYQESFYVSPARQVDFDRIEFGGLSQAKTDLAKLQKTPSLWSSLAKSDSIDASTRDNNGDIGYQSLGPQDPNLEAWYLNPSRKVGEMSGILDETAGTFDIIRIVAINPSLAVDSTNLATWKGNALAHWYEAHTLPTVKTVGPDTGMETSSANIPQAPNLNVTFAATPTVGP